MTVPQKLFQRFLYIGSAFDVVSLQQPPDDVPLSLRQGTKLVYSFFLFAILYASYAFYLITEGLGFHLFTSFLSQAHFRY